MNFPSICSLQIAVLGRTSSTDGRTETRTQTTSVFLDWWKQKQRGAAVDVKVTPFPNGVNGQSVQSVPQTEEQNTTLLLSYVSAERLAVSTALS